MAVPEFIATRPGIKLLSIASCTIQPKRIRQPPRITTTPAAAEKAFMETMSRL